MKYNIELVSSSEHYQVHDENGKDYSITSYREENVGWASIEVIDDETDEDITDTGIGKEIVKTFNNK